MGHYAKVINNVVIEVIVANQDYIDTLADSWAWYEASYNVRGGVYFNPETGLPAEDQTVIQETVGRKRKNFPAIGYNYNQELDAFIPPTPYPSWILNESTGLWNPPVPHPEGNKQYVWNEYGKEWVYSGYYLNEEGELIRE